MYPEPADSWTHPTKSSISGTAGEVLAEHRAAPDPLTSAAHGTEGVTVACNDAEVLPVKWRPRPNASHLSRAHNGVYYVRLMIPDHVRALRPDLPREIRRSTKTTAKQPALRHARQICEELVTSLTFPDSTMLVPTVSASPPRKNGFVIEFFNGEFQGQLYPGADAQTLDRYVRTLSAISEQSSNPAVAAQQLPLPATSGAEMQMDDFGGAADSAGGPRRTQHQGQSAISVQSSPGSVSKVLGRQDDQRDPPLEHAKQAEAGEVHRITWLSEAIQKWRTNGGIRFSAHTWKYSYEPSFRMMRELLATERRDIPQPDGSIVQNYLDVRVRALTREAIEDLGVSLRKMPAQQGKRPKVEAPTLLAQAEEKHLPVHSAGNVAQRLRHMLPFFDHAAEKEWIAEGVLSEFKLLLKDADARADNAAAFSEVRKAGTVALTTEDLKSIYESDLYVQGAVKRDWMYWSDPGRLYSGARVSEFAQLFTDDIVVIDGIPCFSFVNDTPRKPLDDHEFGGILSKATSFEEYRRLKNKASRRIIPIAPQLIELGFMEFVRERQQAVGRHPGLLFLGLNWQPKSGYGRRPSEHTLDLLKAAEVWQRRRKVGHSLRASCTQKLQEVGMTGELLDRYLGHSTRTVREKNYNEGAHGPAYPVAIALDFLRKMDFGVKFPTYAEIKQKRAEWAREKQLARKNGYASRNQAASHAHTV